MPEIVLRTLPAYNTFECLRRLLCNIRPLIPAMPEIVLRTLPAYDNPALRDGHFDFTQPIHAAADDIAFVYQVHTFRRAGENDVTGFEFIIL